MLLGYCFCYSYGQVSLKLQMLQAVQDWEWSDRCMVAALLAGQQLWIHLYLADERS